MGEPAVAALSLGGNTGDVAQAFVAALEALDQGGATVIARSSVWRTPPWGKTDQPDFLNMAVLVRTLLAPRALLAVCLEIERQAGRIRSERWGPRSLDIDVLTYADRSIAEPGLTVPHPHLLERAFVLAPLNEIAPHMQVTGIELADALKAIDMSGLSIDPQATALVAA